MATDNLFAILAMIRAELGDQVSDAAWDKIKRMLSAEAGGSRLYIPIARKRIHLDALAAADASASSERLARILGISVRHVQRLKRLRG